MARQIMNFFVRMGLLALASGLLLRLFAHASYTEFASGFLLGLSLVLMIVGLLRKSRGVTK
jgi:hypothetical protein